MTEKEKEIAQKLGLLLLCMNDTERAYTLGFLEGLEVAKMEQKKENTVCESTTTDGKRTPTTPCCTVD